jgi:hypothetical protein
MHPRLEALFAGLEVQRAALVEAVDAVPPALRGERPVPDRWSVAEILDHLAITERRVARILTTKIAEARMAGLAPEEDPSPIPASTRLAMILGRQQRVSAPDVFVPRRGVTIDDAWAELRRTREALRLAALTGDGLALGTLTHPHPFAGPFNLYQWIAFVGVHEGRHAAQIREIAGV